MRLTLLLTCLAALIAAAAAPAWALEADQYTLPPQPLADIGPEVQDEVRARLRAIVDQLNAELDALTAEEREAREDTLQRRAELALAINRRLGEAELARRVDEQFGPGWPETRIEQWIRRHRFAAQPAIHEIAYGESIFGLAALLRPQMLFAVAPNTNLFGVYCGNDKIGHFFQQGYDYYEVYLEHDARGADEAEATDAAVRMGIDQERGIYGEVATGVYSNADMAANYAGLKFFANLTRPVRLGQGVRPPLLTLENERWRMDEALAADLLEVFVSEHWDEAMNPPLYDGWMRLFVRGEIRKRMADWLEFHGTSGAAARDRAASLQTWFGEDYGHRGGRNLILPGAGGGGEAVPPGLARRAAR